MEVFKEHISKKISLSDDEFEDALRFFISQSLKKKEFLLKTNEPCLYNAFVLKGILRSYTVDGNEKEHIAAFAFEGYWLSDLHSYCSGHPSRFCIDAIEETDVLLLTFEAMENMCAALPKFDRFFRILFQRSIASLSYRLDDTLTLSAKDKYDQLLKMQPDILQRIPQYQIASYLGVTPESLSRIRKPAKRG